MFIDNNGVKIEVFNDGSVRFGGKLYHDDDKLRLKNFETKASLFSDSEETVIYGNLPKRLRERLNATLNTIFERLDENKDEGFVGINHLRAFGFRGEDRARIKRAASDMNLIAYQMGLGSFTAAYERFKASEQKSGGFSKGAADFIADFIKSKDLADGWEFFESELLRLGVSKTKITQEYNSIVFSKNKIAQFMRMDKEKRVDAFLEDYKKNEFSSFSYFSVAMQSFGVDNSDIFKKYIDLGGKTDKKIEDFYSEVYKNKVIPDRVKIEEFIRNYKESGVNDFSVFHETLQDYGVTNTKEILLYFHDSIDESFKLSSREFGLVCAAKKELIELQEKIINDAIEAGYEVPSNLSRLVSPSDKIKDETINPQKIKMVASFDFAKEQNGYKSESFDSMGNIGSKARVDLDEKIVKELGILQKDTNQSTGFINVMLIQNNGFSFERMKEFVLYSGENNLLSPQKGMSVAMTGLKQCNKLVECGILKSEDGKNFTFSSPRCREILFENPLASYNQLTDLVIKEHNISFDKKEADKQEDKPLNRELFEVQKAEFEEFLDAQYKSYYLPQGLGFEEFKNDVLAVDSQESQRFRDLYPELKKGIDFKDAIADFIEKDKYLYIRQGVMDFSSKEVKGEVDVLWKNAQKINRELKSSGALESNEKVAAKSDFINLSAVAFNGIDFNKLQSWGESTLKKGFLSKKEVDSFITDSLKRGEALASGGVMVKNEKGFSFVDNFAKESLLRGYDKSVNEIVVLNRGERVLRSEVVELGFSDKAVAVQQEHTPSEKNIGVVCLDKRDVVFDTAGLTMSSASLAVIDKLNHFNYVWKLSGDEKYRNMMAKIESELKSELMVSYFSDKELRGFLDEDVKNIQDLSGLKQIFFDEFYEDVENIEKQDAKAVFGDILNRADLGEEMLHG